MTRRDVIETVVVTGASAGVGRAIAVAFGRRGCKVGLIARGREGLESTMREIIRLGGEALVIEADVGDAEAMMVAADQVEAELGPIDLWVNNAMVTVYGASVDISPEEFHQVTRVSYLGQVHGTLAALRQMRPRNRGAIISIGSALAYRSIPFQAPYCAAKAATRGFIDSLRSELMAEHSAITLTMVHLPAVNTPQFDWARNKFDRKAAPVPPIYQPEAIAAAVIRAAERAPREYWVGASAVKAILGQMLMPPVVDRILARAGVDNETSDEPEAPHRPDNLFDAGRGDPGAHGRFDRLSSTSAFPFNPDLLRAGVAVGAVAAGLALLFAAVRTEHGRQRAPRPLSPPR
ncbi:short-subunit dehydrogenase [Rhodopseudomonas thermotolerans]|uniref:Short-subunit dehydrogenase n=2 Tax=Rhodopseudomonas TaxID=1073 RepID=A0A336JM58_9BRAD|nr:MULTISPECIES: SDR family oxidoreductase [Rhodopseudomonas]RED36237.1 short-subunit dehydrogenase [Rhodopseudomonas pentothenatexigens]REG03610.1 short-subunit dehydrogenase [Rhodopseudomonas thermotolerans]SSW90797.1 short-subunit dehydrogenase [Rhodopseudomonas pentothenatexigens]